MNENDTQRMLSFLGLCVRARQIIYGQEACVAAMRADSVDVVLLDAGASSNTRKRITDASCAHTAAVYEIAPGLLGGAIGKSGCMVVSLPRGKMSDRVKQYLESSKYQSTCLSQNTLSTDAGVQAQQ